MPVELPKTYDPKESQTKWLALWEERGYFHSTPDGRKPFTIVIPPPNVTGALHMGHALNSTLQDVLIRWRRMQGYNALWIPGTDHAGIATQAVVEKLIFAQEKKTRHDLGRDELVKRIWQWKDKYEARILGQLREMGTSCDWQRTRFTLDDMCAKAVRETFFRMFKDGYIYRGKRLVNWDAHLQTSVADDETYTEDTKGGFWTFKYPVVGLPDTFIRFSTTRPETMLGDTALCVHPSDERYKQFHGMRVLQVLTGREIPIVTDGILADPELGTGCVKVTPAHDANDYACYQRHPEIGVINILNPDGTINAEGGGQFAGLDRYKAREAVVRAMEELGFFEGKEDRVIPLKFSDRSKTPIEPYLSDQWFVKMSDLASGGREPAVPGLAQMAMDAVTSGRVKFFPERYMDGYLAWLGEKRDWCISRQLWWGHRIPVWRKSIPWNAVLSNNPFIGFAEIPVGDSGPTRWSQQVLKEEYRSFASDQSRRYVDEDKVEYLELLISTAPGHEAFEKTLEQAGLVQDEDVLDTWFSSALWPHSTLGWPEKTPEADYYYPTSVLVTNRDIITLWVARMVLTGLFNLGEVPFHHVYIHPKVMDGFGEGMSKSKGNGVDPLDIIELYGTDAMRYGMVKIATETQDSRMPITNVCPFCSESVAVKQEHMYMRTKKLVCPKCKKSFRPGGPWPADDPELPTAKQGSDRFEEGRNFANKMWNATRFILMNLEGYSSENQPDAQARGETQPLLAPRAGIDVNLLPIEDRWLLSRLATTTKAVTDSLENYEFSKVSTAIYDFVWSEFCDWYIEMAKGRLKEPEALATGRTTVQRVLVGVLDGILRLVQPVMPFVAESLWHALNEAAPVRGLPLPVEAGESVVIAPWPEYPPEWIDAGVEARFARMQELVRGVREVRNRYQVDDKTHLDVSVKASEAIAKDFTELAAFIGPLAGIAKFTASPHEAKPKQAGTVVRPEFEAYVSLVGLIDPTAEGKRLEKQIGEKTKQLEGVKAKLANPNFTKAPSDVQQIQRDLATDLKNQIRALNENLIALQD